MKKDISLYIHIPFCESKCYYCDFASYSNIDEKIENYIDCVCMEILQNAEILSQYNIQTIYFGGGTPSYIDAKYIKKIMDIIRLFSDNNNTDNFSEVTIEVNPNSVTNEKIQTYIKSGINRISIGLQSTHNDVLECIGRKHKYEDFLKVLDMCKSNNLNNISLDIIYPLPNLGLKKFSQTIDTILKLGNTYNIQHISVYNLEVHPKTKMEFLLNEGFLELVDEEVEYEMKEILEEKLNENKYKKYEVSNFAKEGFTSKHNMRYWKQEQYIGFGISAASFFAGTRYTNTSNLNEYIDCINNGKNTVVQKDELDKMSLIKEYVILNLRLVDGINVSSFYTKFKIDIFNIFNYELTDLKEKGLIDIDKNKENIRLTKRGFEVANIVWEKFI